MQEVGIIPKWVLPEIQRIFCIGRTPSPTGCHFQHVRFFTEFGGGSSLESRKVQKSEDAMEPQKVKIDNGPMDGG